MMMAAAGLVQGQVGVKAGQLTAGEIHDFSKWALWEDLTEGAKRVAEYLEALSSTSLFTEAEKWGELSSG